MIIILIQCVKQSLQNDCLISNQAICVYSLPVQLMTGEMRAQKGDALGV